MIKLPYCFCVRDYESCGISKSLLRVVYESFHIDSRIAVLCFEPGTYNCDKPVYLIEESDIPNIMAVYEVNNEDVEKNIPEYFYMKRASEEEVLKYIEKYKNWLKEADTLENDKETSSDFIMNYGINFEQSRIMRNAKLQDTDGEDSRNIDLNNADDLKKYCSRNWYIFLPDAEIENNQKKICFDDGDNFSQYEKNKALLTYFNVLKPNTLGLVVSNFC